MLTSLVQKNQQSALSNAKFVHENVSELLAMKYMKQVKEQPCTCICSPLLVVQNSTGNKKLVINLRYLNRHLWKQHFKYEDCILQCNCLSKATMFSFDLKSGYHHVDIAAVHQPLLRFQWEGAHYQFTVLSFGLSTTCYIFTKFLCPLVHYWCSRGIRITLYLDNGVASAPMNIAQLRQAY